MIQFNKTILHKNCILQRLSLLVMLLYFCTTAYAGESRGSGKYAKATVQVTPSAVGRVYVDAESTPQTDPPYNQTELKVEGQVFSLFWIFDIEILNTITFNLYAEDVSNNGYVFGGWYEGDATEPFETSLTAQTTIATSRSTNSVTYTAKWLEPKVTAMNPQNIDFGTIDDPSTVVAGEVIAYTIADYMGTDNYVMSTTNSFTHNEGNDPIDETANTYTTTITYSPKGIHGTHTGEATLASRLYINGKTYTNDHQTCALTITEDYTPLFTAQNNSNANRYKMGNVPIGSSIESTSALHTTYNNYAASVSSTTNTNKRGTATWTYTFDEFSLSGENVNNYFAIKEGTGDAGKPTVVFTPGSDFTKFGFAENEEGQKVITARMSIQCTYYDANNTPVESTKQYSYLTVTVKQENTSTMSFNNGVTGDFGTVVMGERPTLSLGMYIANVSFDNDACILTGDGANLFTIVSEGKKPQNGAVAIQISENWSSFSGCNTHTATLKVTGTRTAAGKNGEANGTQVTATITISAQLILGGELTLTPASGDKLVSFTWNKLIGAKYYDLYYKIGSTASYTKVSIVSGTSIANLTSNENTYTYTINHSGNGSNYQTFCYVVAKSENNNSYTVEDGQLSPETNCMKLSSTVDATPVLGRIDKNNASNPGIKTGIKENDSYTSTKPNALNRSVNVSSAFDASGMPIVDRLYIFGETYTQTTVSGRNPKTEVITPLYVYAKDGDGYALNKTITNARTTRDAALTIDATNVSALFFTGYCDAAYTGNSQEGVVHIKGGSKTVDVYINDLQIYASDNTQSTTLNWDNIQSAINDGMSYYSKNKGSVFVLQSSSRNESAPFAIKMHIRGENILDAGKGGSYEISATKSAVISSKTIIKDNPHHYSSPICILPVATGGASQKSGLTIDDIWHNNQRTHGSLSLRETDQTDNNSNMSIDLGNSGSTLTFDGGQYTFMSTAAAYRTSTYSAKVEDTQVQVTTYGLVSKEPDSDGDIDHISTINAGKSVALKDGTFNGTTTKFYASALTIDGGSYNTTIQHYNPTLQEKLYNSDQKELGKATIAFSDFESLSFGVLMDKLFPDYGVNATVGTDQNYHYPLSAYYSEEETGKKYGCASVEPKDGKLYFMLPTLDCSNLHLPWQICSPNMTAQFMGTDMEFGGDINRIQGCNTEAHRNTSRYTIDRLLYMQIDDYTVSALDDYYFYDYQLDVKLKDQSENPKLYGTIKDDTEYTIQNKVYMLMPIVAAKWMLFAAPYDVANVYVIESYPEAQLTKDHGSKRGKIPAENVEIARIRQAQRFMDLYTIWYYEEKGIGEPYDFFGTDPETDPYGNFVDAWMAYESKRGKDNISLQEANPAYIPIVEKLIHFMGKEADYSAYGEGKNWLDANYYLYQLNGAWTLDKNNHYRTTWSDVTTVANGTNAIMNKGQVYAIQFPYNSINGTHDPSTTWDYWTGKYLLIESTAGPHTINGSNFITSALSVQNVTSSTASLFGNSTFAEIAATMPTKEGTSTTMWALEKQSATTEGGRDIHEMVHLTNTTLAPTSGVLLANFQAPQGMIAKSINYTTGEITYEKVDDNNTGDIETGLPTIAGDLTLLVESTEQGLTITPIKEQHVMLFDADGKMIFSKHLSAEENVTLPTGVYVVRGEYEQVKAIKK